MALIHVALAGPDPAPVLVAVRELGAERVVLVGTEDQRATMDRVTKVLEPMGIAHDWRTVTGNPLLGTIQALQAIQADNRARVDDLLVNLGGASKAAACAGLSAAFVAGVEAVDIMDGRVVTLPVLHFSKDSDVSYHIRGGREGKGLVELGLVEVDRGANAGLTIRLTPMGELLARGMQA